MKRIFFSAILFATTFSLFGQETQIDKLKIKEGETKIKYDDGSKIKYENSSVVPISIRSDFEIYHPGVTVIAWESVDDWWYAIYKTENNRLTYVFYNTQPYYLERNETFILATPVLNTYVPEEVVTTAINNYGGELYSITGLRSAEGENLYQVCLIKNKKSELVMMNENAVVVARSF